MTWLLALAVLSGLSFSLIGVCYRLGQPHNISTLRVALGMGVGGSVVFIARAWGTPLGDVPARVWIAGAVVGFFQYLSVRLIRVALARGPLSPVWCSVSLAFVLAVIYGGVVFGERIDAWQVAGIAAGIGCVLVGAFQHRGGDETKKGSVVVYAAILILIFFANGLNFTAVRELDTRTLSEGVSYMAKYRDVYLAVLYLAIAVFTTADLTVCRHPRVSVARWAVLGSLAGAGSVGGMTALIAAASLPSAVVFTLSNISSILSGSIVSVLFLREKATRVWLVMMALGMLAVVLVNIDVISHYLLK